MPGRIPRHVRAAVTLEPGERVLAWGDTGTDLVVATTYRLVLPGGAAPGWDDIDRVSWDDDGLRVWRRAAREPVQLPITRSGRLPEVVRTAVTEAVVHSRRVQLEYGPTGARGARLVCRRSPRTGELGWDVAADPGVDLADPVLQARLESALTDARRDLGT